MRSRFKVAAFVDPRHRIFQGVRATDDIPTDYTTDSFDAILSRWGFDGTVALFFEEFSNACNVGGQILEDFIRSFRQAICVPHDDWRSMFCSIPNEITKMLIDIVLTEDIPDLLLIDTLYVLDVVFIGDPSAENLLCNRPVLDLMRHVFESCLTELFPFTIADSFPLLNIAINLVSSDRNAELMFDSPFSALCTSSFLQDVYPNAEESSPEMAGLIVRLVTRVFIHQSDSFVIVREVVNEIMAKFVGILRSNFAHNGLSGALLTFFTDFLNFRQGADLVNFIEHDVFRAVAELIRVGFFDTPVCWALFADACRYARFCEKLHEEAIKDHIYEVVDLKEAWEEMTPGMDSDDGCCCKMEYNVLSLTYNYILLFQVVPAVVTTENFVTTGEMILEDARPDVTEMFIILMAEIVEYSILDFSVLILEEGILAGIVTKVIPGPDEPIMKAALRIVELCLLSSIVGVPDEDRPALLKYEINRELGPVAAFLWETIEAGGELAAYATQIFNECYSDAV
jgi:hypothetical protein